MQYVAPVAVGVLYALLMSFVREPHRRRLNAVMLAGAGAAYLSGGGLGGWEFAFTALIAYVAFRGLDSWTFIGIGWLLHTAWDVVHHLKGNPIVPFAHLVAGLRDLRPGDRPVVSWGGPSLIGLVRRRRRGRRPGSGESTPAEPAGHPGTGAPVPSGSSS
ncbi:hypothetical protein SHIRM173S_02996 [Streptomyces hirsutus]